jgi:iron-sulfur cluster repair protein YtfE (RIC family)
MNAITMLETQHKKAKAALKKLSHGYDKKTLETVASELAAHMVTEETIFYPAVRRVKPDLVMESYEEHAIAQLALKRLLSTEPKDARFKARAKALFDLIDHHVDEEEDELFPKVKKALDSKTLDALGERMKERFDALVEEGHDAVIPSGAGKTTADRSSAHASQPNGHSEAGHA